MNEPVHAVGIDLGTTHCALSSIDLELSEGEELAESAFSIPQVVAPGQVEKRALLPSFLYLPHDSELSPGSLTLPWPNHPTQFAVGEVARVLGIKSAARLVSSAKSWLGYTGIDRRAPSLPPGAAPEIPKVSPLDASVRYLEHLRAAWDAAHVDAPLDQQLVTITVPASFDPAARELTAEAARLAGIGHAVLLEEPQAALYSWVSGSHGDWRKQVGLGDAILVIDVGGGTSDFSLIAVNEQAGELALERIAVGEHILLGGDNMDLALAYLLRTQLEAAGHTLDPVQVATLTQAARVAKEQLLSDLEVASAPVTLPGRGSKLIGSAISTELTRADMERVLLEGFFPLVEAHERPVARARTAFRQLGLPYAQDAAVTRHLAAFLARQAGALEDGAYPFARPTAVLFNGGVFKSQLLQDRIVAVLDNWLASTGAEPVRVLLGADLDLAVARGAAYYGQVRQGGGIRIRGGTAMAYYIGVESSMPAVPGLPPPIQAVCVAPFGLEEGTRAELPEAEFGLVIGEPVRFRFFGSSVRRDDRAGDVLERWTPDEMQELQEIEAMLPSEGHGPGEVVTVQLQAGVTEVGTLELEAVEAQGEQRWKVEFDTRAEA
ncbi:MAG: putative heat-shock chaperone Hsp70/DnaK [Myxococcaceae bacterium]|nr:putative heat-shock chaperone Hsp70/DnaK [Myxococcaceae bacterium]